MPSITRRSVLAAGAASAAILSAPSVFAQAKPKLRIAAVFTDQDIR
ncbi:MAG: C4-dicarboxylate ABC transporter, partial [Alphaproteobacteria bacterium]|nr:C4-dicarboxylate ABC transporter [Alphaproteobacteria bacterium]